MTRRTAIWLLVMVVALTGSCVFGDLLTVKNDNGELHLNGLIQTYYAWFEESNATDTFELHRVELGATGTVYEKIDFAMLMELDHSPKLLDAWVRLKYIPYVDFTFGQMWKPVTYEALTSSAELPFIEYSLPTAYLMNGEWSFKDALSNNLRSGGQGADIRAFAADVSHNPSMWDYKQEYSILNRDVGAKVTFHVEQDDFTMFLLEGGVFNGTGINRSDDNDQKDWVGRICLQPIKGINFFANYTYGSYGHKALLEDPNGLDPMFGHEEFQQYSGGLAIDFLGLDLAGEAIGMRRGYIHNQYTDSIYEGITSTSPTSPPYHYQMVTKRMFDPDNRGYDTFGYYAYVGYKIETGCDYFKQIEPIVRYEFLDPNLETDFNNDQEKRLTFGLNIFILENYAKLQLNYIWNMNDSGPDCQVADNVWGAQLQARF